MTISLILKPSSLKIGQNLLPNLNITLIFLTLTFLFQLVILLNINICLESFLEEKRMFYSQGKLVLVNLLSYLISWVQQIRIIMFIQS